MNPTMSQRDQSRETYRLTERDNEISGTVEGGKQAAETNKRLFGSDYYKTIGKIGGASRRSPGGFASDKVDSNGFDGRDRARIAGRKGGLNRWRSRDAAE